ncbi:hypothetical protein WA158_005708 [Blastocystis sp. Blastoise]
MKTRCIISILIFFCISPIFGDEYESWMEDNYDFIFNRTLFEITLPGTHDSGAYWFSKEIGLYSRFYNPDEEKRLLKGVPEDDATNMFLINLLSVTGVKYWKIGIPWGITQSYNISEQLYHGIRYNDLRVLWNGKNWYIYS